MYEIEDMPAAEYFGWLAFYEDKERQRQAAEGNLLAMDPEQMIGKLTDG